MPILPIIVAAVAAGGILLIVIALAGSAPVDPVQARLTQLGTMQAKNLEELELQQPFIERTLRPLAARLSGSMTRVTSSSFSETTGKRLALAGNPGDMRVSDWLAIKAVGAIIGAILFFVLFTIVNPLKMPFVIGLVLVPIGALFGYTIRERVRIKGEIRTLTAQQRMSGYVVAFLPIGLVVLLTIIAPSFMQPMLDPAVNILGIPTGIILMAIGGFMMFIGFMIIRRIVDIEV